MGKDSKKQNSTVVENRKARYEYHIDDTMEAGLVLHGTEVKSLRAGKGNLQDAYAEVKNGEVWVNNFHISPYEQGNIFNHEPKRPKKLLLHSKEIDRLYGLSSQKGYTLIPLKIYFKHGRAKLLLGVARGKKLHDKREDIAARDAKREMDRTIKERSYS
ncbi:MAG: SsrA-binding protein SmpB [Candidatus Saccharibacteria bacterium]